MLLNMITANNRLGRKNAKQRTTSQRSVRPPKPDSAPWKNRSSKASLRRQKRRSAELRLRKMQKTKRLAWPLNELRSKQLGSANDNCNSSSKLWTTKIHPTMMMAHKRSRLRTLHLLQARNFHETPHPHLLHQCQYTRILHLHPLPAHLYHL